MNAENKVIAMSNMLKRIVLALLSTIILAGCGQKGPLFLPGDPNAVRTTTPQQGSQAAEENDEDDEDETPITIQN